MEDKSFYTDVESFDIGNKKKLELCIVEQFGNHRLYAQIIIVDKSIKNKEDQVINFLFESENMLFARDMFNNLVTLANLVREGCE